MRKRALTTLVFHAWSIFMNEGCYHQVFERLPLNWVYNNLCLATFSVHTGCSSVSSATAADGYKSANKSSGDVSCLFCSTTFWLRSVISPVELTHFTLYVQEFLSLRLKRRKEEQIMEFFTWPTTSHVKTSLRTKIIMITFGEPFELNQQVFSDTHKLLLLFRTPISYSRIVA